MTNIPRSYNAKNGRVIVDTKEGERYNNSILCSCIDCVERRHQENMNKGEKQIES